MATHLRIRTGLLGLLLAAGLALAGCAAPDESADDGTNGGDGNDTTPGEAPTDADNDSLSGEEILGGEASPDPSDAAGNQTAGSEQPVS